MYGHPGHTSVEVCEPSAPHLVVTLRSDHPHLTCEHGPRTMRRACMEHVTAHTTRLCRSRWHQGLRITVLRAASTVVWWCAPSHAHTWHPPSKEPLLNMRPHVNLSCYTLPMADANVRMQWLFTECLCLGCTSCMTAPQHLHLWSMCHVVMHEATQ